MSQPARRVEISSKPQVEATADQPEGRSAGAAEQVNSRHSAHIERLPQQEVGTAYIGRYQS